MRVDEYQVTFWTRGQYPAAPPRNDEIRLLIGRIFILSSYFIAKINRPPARNGRFRGVFAVFFVLGSWITFLLRNYPYNMMPKSLRQYFF